jgi:hypothetical protein
MQLKRTVSLAALVLFATTAASAQSRKLIGLGVGMSADRLKEHATWDSSIDWVVFRIPRPERLGIAWDIGSNTDDVTIAGPLVQTASVRMRHVLFGPAYTWRVGRTELTASALAGPSFNSLRLPDGTPGNVKASADHSFAFKPDVTCWIDLAPLVGLKLSASYVFTGTDLTLVDGAATHESNWNGRRLHTQVAIVVGIY